MDVSLFNPCFARCSHWFLHLDLLVQCLEKVNNIVWSNDDLPWYKTTPKTNQSPWSRLIPCFLKQNISWMHSGRWMKWRSIHAMWLVLRPEDGENVVLWQIFEQTHLKATRSLVVVLFLHSREHLSACSTKSQCRRSPPKRSKQWAVSSVHHDESFLTQG